MASMMQLMTNDKAIFTSGDKAESNQSFLSFLGEYSTNLAETSLLSNSLEDQTDLNINIETLILQLTELLNEEEQVLIDGELMTKISQLQASLTEEDSELNELLSTLLEQLHNNQEDSLQEKSVQLIESILLQLETQLSNRGQEVEIIQTEPISSEYNVVEIDDEMLLNEIQQLTDRLHLVLGDLDVENVKQTAVKLMPLLQQLSQLINGNNKEDVMKLLNEKLPKQVSDVLTRLVTSFQSRHNFARSGAYTHEAEVTTEDVSRWLSDALSNQEVKLEQSLVTPVRTGTDHVPMSKVEQYVVHLNELSRVERVQEQLVRQLETVMKQSKFLQTPNLTQLSLTLKPNHLGNVHVQLMEVNGEMTVKLIASSVAAKKLLESNIHQLKHMFAPHNVTIEREETKIADIDQLDEQLDEEEEQAMSEEERNQEDESSQENKNQFAESFQDVLLDTHLDGEELLDD